MLSNYSGLNVAMFKRKCPFRWNKVDIFSFLSLINFIRTNIGIVFIINGGFYAATAPMWGCLVDKFLNPKVAALIGSCMIVAAFSLIGPVSFIPCET